MSNFFEGKKVLVAGSTGLVGSCLTERLIQLGAKVRATYHTNYQRPHENPQAEHIYTDLTRIKDCRDAVKGMDYVFMCAAVIAGAGVMVRDPLFNVFPNVALNSCMLQAAYEARVQKYLTFGSSTAYPDSSEALREDQMMEGEPYEKYFSIGWVMRLKEKLCQLYNKGGLPVVVLRPTNIYGPCFSSDTDVLTSRGIVNIKDIKSGDMVYSINPKTMQLEKVQVIATHYYKSDTLISIKSQCIDWLITPEHKLFLRSSTNCGFKRAEQLNLENHFQYGLAWHTVPKNGVRPQIFDLSPHIDSQHIRQGNFVRDFKHSHSQQFPVYIPTEIFLKILAWYIAEGSVAKIPGRKLTRLPSGKISYQIIISQALNSTFREEIKSVLSKAQIHWQESRMHISFTSRLFYNFLHSYNLIGSKVKSIPPFIFDYEPDLRRIFLKTLMAGDGDKTGKRYSTASSQLMKDFYHLAFTCGVKISIIKYDGCWRIGIRQKRTHSSFKPHHCAKVYSPNTDTYCITLERNHTVFAGRNYKLNWIGQCDNFDLATSHVTPALIRKAVEHHDPLEVWGNGEEIRDLVYVEDVADAALLTMEKIAGYEPINIAAGQGYSVKEILATILAVVGYLPQVVFDATKPTTIPIRLVDTTKARALLSWQPKVGLPDGIARTVAWFQENGAGR